MKKLGILFIFGIILYGCESNVFDELDNQEAINAVTRTTDNNYIFEGASFNEPFTFEFDCFGENLSRRSCVLSSYVTSDNVNTSITPEVVSIPSWCNVSLVDETQWYFIYGIHVSQNATDSERSGYIRFKQPGSNKILSIGITQYTINNYIRIQVNKTYNNHYKFIATTDYPVKGNFWVRIPVVVYNDGGELTHEIGIDIAKGERTGSSEADWNSSPLVQEHGDIKGYRLSEGRFGGDDDVYTYSFIRYW